MHCFSILGRIVRVTDEVVEYRQWIRESFPIRQIVRAPSKSPAQTRKSASHDANANTRSSSESNQHSYASALTSNKPAQTSPKLKHG